ncbi:putative non-specific serine/threonine protein kinase [Helianthus anomalus]
MAVLLVLLVLLLTEPGFSQTNNHDNDTNDRIGYFCGRNAVTSLPNFVKNRNTTLSDLRMQLLSKRVVYAKAQALSAGDPVFAAAQCRNYLSVDRCVACFDAGVSELTNCSAANGYVIFDNCFIRYEDFDEFYPDPYFMMDGTGSQYLSCGNNQSTFNQGVDGVLSNIKDATPKTSNYYVASITQVTSENATVYATAQCIANINQTICQTCMNAAYDKLTTCLPSTQGRFSDMACFVRYSELPFFDDNQTTDITTVLKGEAGMPLVSNTRNKSNVNCNYDMIGHSRKLVAVVAAAVGGVVLFFLILVLWLFYRRKKSKKTAQGDFIYVDFSLILTD